MIKKKLLEEAKSRYETRVRKINAGFKLYQKVKPVLPKSWGCSFSIIWNELQFSRAHDGTKANALEFRVVCDLIEKATGKPMQRSAHGNKESGHSLYGSSWVKIDREMVNVSVSLTRPEGCKVEYVEVTETRAVVDDECLGIRKEEVKSGEAKNV